MSATSKNINIFIASSNELAEERELCEDIILKMNAEIEDYKLLPKLFESHLSAGNHPGYESIQDRINKKLLNKSDVLICLFHTKIGDWTKKEFELGIEQSKKVFAFWKQDYESLSKKDLVDKAADFSKLNRFFENKRSELLYVPYDEAEKFPELLKKQLELYFKEIKEEEKQQSSNTELATENTNDLGFELSHKSSQEQVDEFLAQKDEAFRVLEKQIKELRPLEHIKDKEVISRFKQFIEAPKLDNVLVNAANDFRKNAASYQYQDKSLIVSALTLSILHHKAFDIQKFDLLLDYMTDFEEGIWQRALVGIICGLVFHDNRLQKNQKQLVRLKELQQNPKIQNGISSIALIFRHNLHKKAFYPVELVQKEFIKDNVHNWFYPFYNDNPELTDCLNNTESDIDVEVFKNFIQEAPFIDAVKYAFCNGLKNNKVKVNITNDDKAEKQKENFLKALTNNLTIAHIFAPYYNILSELHIFFKHHSEKALENLFNKKVIIHKKKLAKFLLSEAQKLEFEAQEHVENNRLEPAIEKYESILKLNPNDTKTKNQLAELYASLGVAIGEEAEKKNSKKLFLESCKKCERAVQLNSNSYVGFGNWGTALVSLGEITGKEKFHYQAIEKYEKALELKPDSYEVLGRWGAALNELGKFTQDETFFHQAIEKYKKSLELKPDYYEVLGNWGNSLNLLAQLKQDENFFHQAIEKYRKVLKIKSDDYKAFYAWGITLSLLGELKQEADFFYQAIDKYRKALEIKPDDSDIYHNWGGILNELGKLKQNEDFFHQAIEKYKKVIQIKPDDSDIYHNWGATLAEFYHLTQNKDYLDQALIKLKKGVKLGSTPYNLACAYALLKDKKNALLHLKTSLKNHNTKPSFVKSAKEWAPYLEDADFKALLAKYEK